MCQRTEVIIVLWKDTNKGTDSSVLFQEECIGYRKQPKITLDVIICNKMRGLLIFPTAENHHILI